MQSQFWPLDRRLYLSTLFPSASQKENYFQRDTAQENLTC
jgi:hypothetical protein